MKNTFSQWSFLQTPPEASALPMISGSQRNFGPQFRHFLAHRNFFYIMSSKTIPTEVEVEQSCAKTQVLHNSHQRHQKTSVLPQPGAQTHNCVLDWLIQCGVIVIRRVRSHRDGDLPFHWNILGYRHICQTWELNVYTPLGRNTNMLVCTSEGFWLLRIQGYNE